MVRKQPYFMMKTALVTGVRPNASLTGSGPNTPEDLKYFASINGVKAQEPKSKWETVLPTSAGVGAGVGIGGKMMLDRMRDPGSEKAVADAAQSAAIQAEKKLYRKVPAYFLNKIRKYSPYLAAGGLGGVAVGAFAKYKDDKEIDRAKMVSALSSIPRNGF